MKKAIRAALLLCGLLVGESAPAQDARIERPHWVIVATIIDLGTGELLGYAKLPGRELKFDDPTECQSVIDRIHAIPTDRVTAVLTCARVGPAEEAL